MSLFKPSDFAQVGWKPGQEKHAAEIANERTMPLIEALRTVETELLEKFAAYDADSITGLNIRAILITVRKALSSLRSDEKGEE